MMTQKPRGMLVKSAFALLAFTAFCLVADFLLPVLISIAFSYLLYPIVRTLEKITWGRDRRMPSAVAVLLSFVIFLLFMSAALQILMVPLVTQVNTLTKALPGFAAQVSATMNWFFGPEARAALPANVQALINEALTTAGRNVMALFQDLISSTFRVARSMASMVLVPFLTFYFLKDWRTLKAMAVKVFPYDRQALAEKVLEDIGSMLCTYVDNMLKLCLVAAGCLTVGNYVLGVQYTLVLGLLAMLTELIPLVGSVVGTLVAVLSLSCSGPPWRSRSSFLPCLLSGRLSGHHAHPCGKSHYPASGPHYPIRHHRRETGRCHWLDLCCASTGHHQDPLWLFLALG